MKAFEEYEAEAQHSARVRDRQRRWARQKEAERKRRLYRMAVLLCGLAFLAGVAVSFFYELRCRQSREAAAPAEVQTGRLRGDDVPATEYASLLRWAAEDPETAPDVQEDYENEKIEAALYAQGYFRADIPLDGELQSQLRGACEESGVDYELMLAIIRKETGYRNVMGDGGDSYGYCQVQPKWHRARMARLGVTDLMDPFGNFRVACDYMADLLSRYDVENALTAYNSGHPGHSDYARTVMGYWEELKNG